MIQFVSLVSGSSGNASFLSDGRTNILIDCGLSGKRLKELLSKIDVTDIDAVLITHEHSDHTKGAGVAVRKYNVPLYATENTHVCMKNIGKIEDRRIVKSGEYFEIGNIAVKPFEIPHDAAEPVGYSFEIGNEKFTVATDIGHMNGDLLNNLSGSKMIILESNHDVEMLRCGGYPYPLKQRILGDFGHLSNENAAKTAAYLVKSGTENIALGHLSRENNYPEIAMMETYNVLSNEGISVGRDVILDVAKRDDITVLCR